MIKVIIVEDNANHSERLVRLIEQTGHPLQVESICGSIDDAVAAISSIQPRIVFLDIDLEGGQSGFDLLKRIDSISFDIIFTTAHSDQNNMVNAIRVCALDYLVKPVTLEELKASLDRFVERKSNNTIMDQIKTLVANSQARRNDEMKVWIPIKGDVVPIPVKNIIACESNNTYTTFHLQKAAIGAEKIVSSKWIKDWEEVLTPHGFCRIHNEHIANLAHVSKYTKGDGGYVTMSNKLILPISKGRKEDFLRATKQK